MKSVAAAIMLALASSIAYAGCIDCPWVDWPAISGRVFLDGSPKNLILVHVKNVTQDIEYDPWGPDPSCECYYPETLTHTCAWHGGPGWWASFWEIYCPGGEGFEPFAGDRQLMAICDGDSLEAWAVYEGDTVLVDSTYVEDDEFIMPDMEFWT
jgi:hypothetical protein